MKKYLAKALGLTLALSTVMAVPTQAAMVINDLDGDGYINKYDAMIAIQGALQDPNASDFTAKDRAKDDVRVSTVNADLDKDSKITANDAALYMNLGVTVNVSITNGEGETQNYKVAALKSDNVIDLFEAKIDNNDPQFDKFFNDYLTKIQDKADRSTVTYKGVKYSIYDSEGQQKIADEINSIKGYENKFSAAKFKALMPKSKSDITKEYIKNFPRKFSECFDPSVRDNKDYAKAAAAQLRSYDNTKGDGAVRIEYADGRVETSAREAAAEAIEKLGFTSLTVGDVINEYGNNASIAYNAYTAVINVTNG